MAPTDGALVAANPNVTSAQVYNGYWRVGYESLGGWTNHPTSNYPAGRLADVAVFASTLPAAQVTSTYAAATQ